MTTTTLAETLTDPAAALLAERVTGTGRLTFEAAGFNSALALATPTDRQEG